MARPNNAKAKKKSSKIVGFEALNHDACVQTELHRASVYCTDKGLRFTSVRRKALEILLKEHRALGAYDVLKRLHAAGFGSQPPVAYRALDFLVSNGFVHKIEKLNAFIACSKPGAPHAPAFLICRACDLVYERIPGPVRNMLNTAANETGFTIEKSIIEFEGICCSCSEHGSA